MRLRVANGNPAARRFYGRLGFVVVEQQNADAVMEWQAPGGRT
jgi:ribosomal protein S18 acetylase RimI-like enzyme